VRIALGRAAGDCRNLSPITALFRFVNNNFYFQAWPPDSTPSA
jgi:hypothetical protein